MICTYQRSYLSKLQNLYLHFCPFSPGRLTVFDPFDWGDTGAPHKRAIGPDRNAGSAFPPEIYSKKRRTRTTTEFWQIKNTTFNNATKDLAVQMSSFLQKCTCDVSRQQQFSSRKEMAQISRYLYVCRKANIYLLQMKFIDYIMGMMTRLTVWGKFLNFGQMSKTFPRSHSHSIFKMF